jgi:hypothetical protein
MAIAARRRSLYGRGALGGAIAAGVAVVSLVMMRTMGPSALPIQGELAQQPAPAPSEAVRLAANPAPRGPTQVAQVEERESPLPSYTTPVGGDSPARRDSPLVNYVVAHNDGAASAVGFAPLFSMMSGSYDLTQDAVEMTAAEVGARR